MDVEPRSSGGTPPHTSSSSYTFDYSTATYQSLGSSSRPINHDVQERLECVALSLEDETPPVRSLLCPAHWGALLESTTVSLVSTMREHAWESSDSSVILAQDLGESPNMPKLLGQGEAESKSSSGDPIGVLIDRGVYTPDSMSGTGDDSRTPQGGQSPQSGMSKCQSEEQIQPPAGGPGMGKQQRQKDREREVQNVCLTLGAPDDSSSLDLIQDDHIPQLVPPLPSSSSSSSAGGDDPPPPLPPSVSPSHQHHTPPPLPPSLPHLLPSTQQNNHSPILTSTSATGTGSRHTGLASPEVRFSSQLSITMEDSTSDYSSDRVTYQSSNLSSPSQRSSLCSSTANMEGDAPGFRHHYYHTHSRNLSETPSLPPFYSSSTSSAYHSRNSSMGSQMSSCCFESDSLLNEMDPTLAAAARTGSYNDLKHPMRMQDSRFSRLGDSSPSSYSSDLSLHHHMNKPIGVADSLLGLSPPNLEDTLRSLPVESLEERKQMATMKSSEWIKRQMSMHRDSIVQVKISSKHKHVVHFNVKAGDIIIWEFATKKKDIGFGVQFEATEVATEESEDSEPPEKEVTAILPLFRVNAYTRPTVGTHTATHDGVYEIIFDNAYSRFFAKELYYRITTQPSEPNANYLEQ